jgi:dTDP-4-dehydrorhamnose reductase
MLELASKQKNVKSQGNSTLKIRALEEKMSAKLAEWEKERRSMFEANK